MARTAGVAFEEKRYININKPHLILHPDPLFCHASFRSKCLVPFFFISILFSFVFFFPGHWITPTREASIILVLQSFAVSHSDPECKKKKWTRCIMQYLLANNTILLIATWSGKHTFYLGLFSPFPQTSHTPAFHLTLMSLLCSCDEH